MNRFQLFLETSDPELFRKATSELGTIFWHEIKTGIYEIVYFSGSRIARYHGDATESIMKLCEANGFEVSEIDLDEATGTLKVKQKEEA
jgi:hypothetical protein